MQIRKCANALIQDSLTFSTISLFLENDEPKEFAHLHICKFAN